MDDVEEIVQLAKALMFRDGGHVPMIFVHGSESKAIIAMHNFGDTASKREMDMLNAGTHLAYKQNVGELRSLMFVSEVWMGRPQKDGNFVQPSLDPKRIEALMVNVLDTATQEQTMIAFEIVRNVRKEVINLKRMSFPEEGSVEGILLPAFQKGYQLVRPILN